MSELDLQKAGLSPRRYWPMPYSGLPGVLNSVGLVMVSFGLVAPFLGDWALAIPLTGIVLLLLSIGREVRVSNDALVLCYGFPVVFYRQVVKDVVEVTDLKKLSRGRLAKYFKLPVAVFLVVALLPLAYLMARGLRVPLVYLVYLLIPVVVCVLLIAYFVLTSTGYLKLLKRVLSFVGTTVCVMSFFVGATYRSVHGHSILEDPHAVAMWIIGVLLLAFFLIAFSIYTGKRSVIVIEDSRGRHYAVVAVDDESAREFMRVVVSRVMARGGGSP